MVGALSIGIDPFIRIGPLTLAWHGLTIAAGFAVGGLVAAQQASRRGLDPEPFRAITLIAVICALVGSRGFYLIEHGGLADPSAWLGSRGFTFYGGFLAAAVGVTIYVWRAGLSVAYLDVIALGLPLGYAVGRVGDIINGEHYGPATTFFLGVQNTHPEADVPSPSVVYHNGGLYESLIGLAVFAMAWKLRSRLWRPTSMLWLVIGLLASGRFIEFFVRSDSATGALGLETAQWVSVPLVLTAVLGAGITLGRPRPLRFTRH